MLSFLRLGSSSGHDDPCLSELAAHCPLGDRQDILILSCCWHPTIPDIIAVTTSTSEVHVFRLDDSWNIIPGETLIHMHDDQAWTAAFLPSLSDSPDLRSFKIFSGGDDFKLLASTCNYDTGEYWSAPEDTKQIGRHEYGVTAILPMHSNEGNQESILLTGSYDDHIRVYVVGGMPRLLAKLNLGGGVWRLKVIALQTETEGPGDWTAIVLASCMYAGARIVTLSGNWYQCKIAVLARFEEHESMNYGSDFQVQGKGKPVRIISTSFYDKRLCLWELP
jgi:diphthine methyl ester acylhydrolase